jgi:hypothetical protein
MPASYLSKITLPVNVSGTIQNVEYTLKDAEARQMIEDLGHALYWIGVTTDALTDGATTNPITVNNESVTANLGGMASYGGSEFVWNGTAWQEMGKNNFGALAFKSSASGSYTPAGQVNVTQASDTTAQVTPFGSAGSLPDATWSVSGETATFAFDAGTLPTAGTAVDVVTAAGAVSAAFVGTAATITVE